MSRAHIFGSAPHEELLRRNIEWALSAFCLKHLLLIISEINETLQGHLNAKQNLQNFADERAQYDSLSDVGEIRVYRRADFQSGSRVLKKVF